MLASNADQIVIEIQPFDTRSERHVEQFGEPRRYLAGVGVHDVGRGLDAPHPLGVERHPPAATLEPGVDDLAIKGRQDLLAVEAEREIGGSVEGLAERLVETRAVIEEAVRLYPPLAAISRAAIAADELLGCYIKPGSMLIIAPYVLHRHRLLWERPDEFDPSRFLGPARSRIDRFAYLPFGVGPRICIGSGFALQEATIVVATVMNSELSTTG